MADEKRTSPPRIHSLDPENLAARLRQAASEIEPQRVIDDLELRHLVRVMTVCSRLLRDVYSEERIARIMHPERSLASRIVERLIEEQRSDDGEVLFRVRRLPDDVRVIGDKALFDLGVYGQRQVLGYDLEQLGVRAYRLAGEVLGLLAEDRRLREFFKQNQLLVLPLEQEVVFLDQCADNFHLYAEILQHSHAEPLDAADAELSRLVTRVPLIAAAAEVLAEEAGCTSLVPRFERRGDAYAAAARGEADAEVSLTPEQQLSAYERILLFSALDLGRLQEALAATVVDQPTAVQVLCDEFSLFAAGTRDPRKPPAYFLVGPTGVGKNHLVESLRRALSGIWKLEIPMLTIEGPNYTYPSDINELRGATRGFIRSDEEGLLTSFHERSSRAPLAILLVDEVEKAHPQLLTFFLSILDRGTTTDNRGKLLNFANCMLCFTSNLGYSDAQQRSAPIGYMDEGARRGAADADIRRELRRGLKPEFINRVRLVHFDRLTRASAERILDLELARIVRRYRELHGLSITLEAAAREELLRRGFSEEYGARHLAATLESVCNVSIAKQVLRDDRRDEGDREALVAWLRELREGSRAYDPEEVRRRVLEQAGARLGYTELCVDFADGEFVYRPQRSGGAS